ncbi:MAG: tRNA threonylcarbamoyladenosine dehydratase [Clostridiales bacterium]|jgi:tRNA A37 threonylcarbamoyladenosine dehydratase|nr:tRNA threonylcarbamoyladenosine dehydratase [Clostridiales bacterium]MDN5298293.1 tRNA threonylcarbamoyladenosine dehydratase [Clostridiales bacterium]
MQEQFERLGYLIGEEGFDKLQKAHVAVFGIGGVGSFTVEALARSGIGKLTLIDFDTVDITNLNRQIHALHSTVGRMKAEVMAERIYAINPDAVVDVVSEMVTPERLEDFFQSDYDFVVDAIDMVSAKLAIIEKCTREGIPIISSMGTGNKLDPTQLTLTDIYKTSVCPLARVMRHELKKRGVRALQVVYSPECPLTPVYSEETVKALENTRKKPPGSTGFVPSAAGLILASAVVRTLLTKTA